MDRNVLVFTPVLRAFERIIHTMSANESANDEPERRKGAKDRRNAAQDRRNDDRVADDPLPRRNPDVPDRREEKSSG